MSGEVVTTLVSMFAMLVAVIGCHLHTMARIGRHIQRIDDLTRRGTL